MRVLTAIGIGVALGGLALVPTVASADMLATKPVATGLQRVVSVASAHDGSGRMFFAEQGGRILVFSGGAVLPTPFLDLTSIVRTAGFEEGLLAVAFHPSYRTNRRFFVYYTNIAGDNVLARYEASVADANVALAAGTVLITFPHPTFGHHNGGGLGFGPDGLLYVSTGDGGGTPEKAQDLGSLLGKVHRIDVDGGQPYAIPPGNPFVSTPGARGEIWAYGLRNPWRLTFDAATGDLWMSDVGEETQDEIDFQPPGAPAGRNYGWPMVEGTFCHVTPCPVGLTPPVLTHIGPEVLAGGYRYRGSGLPLLAGAYIYGGWQYGKLFGAWPQPDGSWRTVPLADTAHSIYAIGEDESGDLYVGDATGVHLVVPTHTLPRVDIDAFSGVLGAVEGARIQVVVRLTMADLEHPVTAQIAAASGTAQSGMDFVPLSQALVFAPGEIEKTVFIDLVDDESDEPVEDFTITLSGVDHATVGVSTVTAQIWDDDGPPVVRLGDASSPEPTGPGGSCRFPLTVDIVSGYTVQVTYVTKDGSAVVNQDYEYAAFFAQLQPGQRSLEIVVPLVPDADAEDNETFSLHLTSVINGTLATTVATCTIVDDDALPSAGLELSHGSVSTGDLAGGADSFRLLQSPRSSYEIVADAVSGDAAPGLGVLRFAADNATVAQSGVAAGTGSSVSLRWQNASNVAIANQPLRVQSGQCTSDCGRDDVYRIRAYETTYRAARFNNTGGQGTVLVLQNPTDDTVLATAWFWSAGGTLLYGHPLSLSPHGSAVLSLGSSPALAGREGSVTLSHDAPYGALVGKTVGLDPTGGFAFDTPLEPRPR